MCCTLKNFNVSTGLSDKIFFGSIELLTRISIELLTRISIDLLNLIAFHVNRKKRNKKTNGATMEIAAPGCKYVNLVIDFIFYIFLAIE